MDLNTVLSDILADVYPAAATFLWSIRALVLFLLVITVAMVIGLWLRRLGPGD